MKFVLTVCLVFYVSMASAAVGISSSCKPVVLKGESVILSTAKPVLFMIHNNSRANLWLTRNSSDPTASAGWTSQLQADNWSALVLNEKKFELNCIESRPGHEQHLPCVGIITICRWPSVSVPAQLSGSFWAGENMDLKALSEHLGGRGFELPDS